MNDLIMLLSGLIAGTILFHSAVVAPTVFRTLKEADASIFLRTIFPKFFLFLSFVSALNFFSAIIDDQTRIVIGAALSTVLMGIAYAIIPMTNRSRDEGQKQRFKQLHRVSVLLTVLVLCINMSFIFI
tara:strand:+ start:436 stop:819 length:384 start_codon:yes stop_codon:yes gene_type:complete